MDLRGELETLKEANGELPAGGGIGPQTRNQSESGPVPPIREPGSLLLGVKNGEVVVFETAPPPVQGAERFNWRDADAAFAVVAKAPDRLRAAYPEKVFENQHAGAIRLLEELAEWFKGVRTRIQESEGK